MSVTDGFQRYFCYADDFSMTAFLSRYVFSLMLSDVCIVDLAVCKWLLCRRLNSLSLLHLRGGGGGGGGCSGGGSSEPSNSIFPSTQIAFSSFYSIHPAHLPTCPRTRLQPAQDPSLVNCHASFII
jgi:hypothetical protein